jgi:hypothetical protein
MTALKHFFFMGNSYFIFLQKFKGIDHTTLLFLNDSAAFLCCGPAYTLYAYSLFKSKFLSHNDDNSLHQSEKI